MKKLLLVALLVVALSAVSVVALAEADIAASYADGTITVNVTGAGEQATVIVLDGDRANTYLEGVNAETLADFQSKAVYVGQTASVEGTASFAFAANANLVSEEVTIYAAGTDASAVVEKLELVEEAAVYNITYDYEVAGAPATYEEGATVTLPTPSRVGYAFGGWLVNGAGAAIFTTEGQTGDLALVASWTELVVTDNTTTIEDGEDGSYGGVYTKADEEGTFGVLSVTAKIGETVDAAKFGFIVYGGGNAIQTTPVDVLEGDLENGFYTVLYNIAEANFDSTVVFKPYVVDAEGAYIYGEAIELKVSDFATNDLGAAEDLGF